MNGAQTMGVSCGTGAGVGAEAAAGETAGEAVAAAEVAAAQAAGAAAAVAGAAGAAAAEARGARGPGAPPRRQAATACPSSGGPARAELPRQSLPGLSVGSALGVCPVQMLAKTAPAAAVTSVLV